MTLADRIKALRERHGWSQYDLADEMGVRQPTISRWESGSEEPAGPSRKLLDILFETLPLAPEPSEAAA